MWENQAIIDFFKGSNYIAKGKGYADIAINNIQHVCISEDIDGSIVVELHGDKNTSSQEDHPIFEKELASLMASEEYNGKYYTSKLIINK